MDTKISRQKFEEKQRIWIVFKNLSQDNDQLQIQNSNFTMEKLWKKTLNQDIMTNNISNKTDLTMYSFT